MPAHALLTLSRALHGATTLEAVLERVRTTITENTRYNRVYVHLFSEDQRTLDIAGWVLPNEEQVRQRLRTIDASRDRFLQRGFALTEPTVVADVREDPDADQEQVAFFGNRTLIVLPMFEGDARIGPMVVPTFADQGVMVPTGEELAFLIQVASLVAVVIGRLRAEEARRAVEEEAAASARMASLGRLAGDIAHDFNNLLVAILVNTELAIAQLGPHPVQAYLSDVQAAAERASAFSGQLVAYARGQAIRRRPVAVTSLLESVEQLVRAILPPGVELTRTVHPGADVAEVDETQLVRALLNLLTNAADAVQTQGRIALVAERVIVDEDYVSVYADLSPGPYLLLSVSDDGVGMDRDLQAHIFEPFFTTKPQRGAGLGLSVVEGIVQQHDGHVHVYSEPGRGTTIRVYLPATPLPGLPGASPPRAAPPSLAQARILIVDDDDSVRRTVERILTLSGATVVACATEAEALAAARSGRYDLLLTDVVLADGDGEQLAKAARRVRPGLPVLLMSGYARGGVDPGDLPLLPKPFTAAELRSRVEGLLAASP